MLQSAIQKRMCVFPAIALIVLSEGSCSPTTGVGAITLSRRKVIGELAGIGTFGKALLKHKAGEKTLDLFEKGFDVAKNAVLTLKKDVATAVATRTREKKALRGQAVRILMERKKGRAGTVRLSANELREIEGRLVKQAKKQKLWASLVKDEDKDVEKQVQKVEEARKLIHELGNVTADDEFVLASFKDFVKTHKDDVRILRTMSEKVGPISLLEWLGHFVNSLKKLTEDDDGTNRAGDYFAGKFVGEEGVDSDYSSDEVSASVEALSKAVDDSEEGDIINDLSTLDVVKKNFETVLNTAEKGEFVDYISNDDESSVVGSPCSSRCSSRGSSRGASSVASASGSDDEAEESDKLHTLKQLYTKLNEIDRERATGFCVKKLNKIRAEYMLNRLPSTGTPPSSPASFIETSSPRRPRPRYPIETKTKTVNEWNELEDLLDRQRFFSW